MLRLSGETGPLDVTASIVGYRADVFEQLSQSAELPKADSGEQETGSNAQMSHTLNLALVADVSVQPPATSLFNHPDNQVKCRCKSKNQRLMK